jgi:hypothetical protein
MELNNRLDVGPASQAHAVVLRRRALAVAVQMRSPNRASRLDMVCTLPDFRGLSLSMTIYLGFPLDSNGGAFQSSNSGVLESWIVEMRC